jgi:hypothetical protein
MSKFEENKPKRINELQQKLNELMDEYHAELYLNDSVYKAFARLEIALMDELNYTIKK